MELKPEEILNIEFGHGFRGYNEAEVNEFLEEITSKLDVLLKELDRLSRENDDFKRRMAEQNQYLERLETSMDGWKKQIEMEKELVQRESQMVLKEAQLKGNRIVEEALKKKKEIEGSYAELREKYHLFQIRFRSFLQTFMDSIEWKEQDATPSKALSEGNRSNPDEAGDDATLFSFKDFKDDTQRKRS
ncbi:MAG: DivIVA domain-containing protein [Candidatus Atribacteria bacterium]|nr:DivIVA domain-containing protein [Candidatus Atribacteria bacterium]